MQQTPNLLLKLPEPTDFVQVEDLNENFTKIDTEIAKITDEETGVEAKLTAHLDESKTGAHKAKNIALEDADGLFVGTELETAMKELFTNVSNGKQLVGTAITDVDDSLIVPTKPTFQQLADLIRAISTGKQWASGTNYYATANVDAIVKVDFPVVDFAPNNGIAFFYSKPGLTNADFKVVISEDFPEGRFYLDDYISNTNVLYTNFSFTNNGFEVFHRPIATSYRNTNLKVNWILFE